MPDEFDRKPVADTWFEIQKLGNGISRIREVHVASWLRCNIWHVQGRDRDLVIDTGMGLRPLKSFIASQTDRPLVCISTHCHFDHIGGAHEFETRLGHRLEADIHCLANRKNAGDIAAFVRAETFSALPYAGFRFETFCVRPAPLTGFLDEGDNLDLGDRAFSVFHMPGHSPGSIGLYEQATGIFFSGDIIYDGALFDTVYHSDPIIYRESLRRLDDMAIATIHGGHFDSFGPDRMRQIVSDYLEGRGRLQDPAAWIASQL